MVLIKTAPHGEWESPITAEAAAAKARVLTFPKVCQVTGRTFFLESRTNGTTSIVEITDKGSKHVLPEEYSASTLLYDLAGLPYAVVPGEELRIIFFDAQNESLNLLHVDSGAVEEIQKLPCTLGYADFDCYPGILSNARNTSWILATQDDHEMLDHSAIDHRIVAINLVTKTVISLLSGTNSCFSPRFSPDGLQISWLQQTNLDQNTQLYLSQFNPETGSLSDIRPATGNDEDSIAEPQWSPDGDLFFTSSESGVRQLSRIRIGTNLRELISLPGFDHADFGNASPTTSSSSYLFLSDSTLLATAHLPDNPTPQLIHIDLASQTSTPLPLSSFALPLTYPAAKSPHSFLTITTSPPAVYRADILTDTSSVETTPLYHPPTQDDNGIPESYISHAQPLVFTTLREPRRDVTGWFFAPQNPRFVGPAEEAPPLVVGLPWEEEEGVNIAVQFLTSRGFAYFALDSCGEGGEMAAEDVAEAVDFLGWSGRVDRGRVGVVGEDGVVELFEREGEVCGGGGGEMGAVLERGVEVGGERCC